MDPARDPPQARALAAWPGWAVHLLTASGALIALLALHALAAGRHSDVLLWLLLALLVDGVDGTLARAVRVRDRVPNIDGEALDLIVDYLNYVLIPVLLMWGAGLLPVGLELALAALVLLSSLYVFTRRDMKTADGYFRGFPALWNVVALYLFIARPDAWLSGAVVAALAAASFAPILFVHPFRSAGFGPAVLGLSALWAAATAALLLPGIEGSLRAGLLTVSLAAAALLVALGLLRTWRGGYLSALGSPGANSSPK